MWVQHPFLTEPTILSKYRQMTLNASDPETESAFYPLGVNNANRQNASANQPVW